VYLKRIRVWNWKAIADLALDLKPGLNVICGPNESGKSSVREALRCAFMTASRPRGRSPVTAARPWNKPKANPQVEIEFWYDEQLWRLKKVFFGNGSELERGGKIVARNDDVQRELDLHLADLAVLWATQGDIQLTEVPTPLRPQLAATEAVTPGISSLEIELRKLYEKHWTAAREAAREPMREASRRKTDAYEQLERIKVELAQVDRVSEAILDLDQQLEQLRARGGTLADERTQIQKQLDAWAAYRRVDAECQALDREAEGLQGWIDRWNRNVEELRVVCNKLRVFEEQLTAGQEKLGEPVDRSAVQRLNARLLYARALLQQRLREEIAHCQAPMPAQIQALDAILRRVDRLADAVRRLEEMETDSDQLAILERELEALKSQHAEMTAVAQQANKRYREADEQSKNACAKLHEQITDLERAWQRWTTLRQQMLELQSELDQYKAKLEAMQRQGGQAPSRDRVDALKAQMAYGKVRYQALIVAELDELKAPTREQLAQLDGLARNADALDEASVQFEVVFSAAAELRRLHEEVARIEQRVAAEIEETAGERSRLAELARQAEQRAQAAAQELSNLTRGREQWIRSRDELITLIARLEDYQQRLEACRDRLGVEPDYSAVESARSRLEYGRMRYEALLRQQLNTLKPPSREELSRFEDAERELQVLHWTGLATASPSNVAWMFGLAVLAAVLTSALGIVREWPLVQTASLAVGAAAVAALAFWLVSRSRTPRASPRIAELENIRAHIKQTLGVASVEEARERLQRADQLKVRIEGAPPLESALAKLREKCPDPESIDALSPEGLAAELKKLVQELERRQSEWDEATKKYSSGRSEWEKLLQDNPERQVSVALNHVKGLSSDFPDLPFEMSSSSELTALRALDTNAVTRWFDEQLTQLQIDAATRLSPVPSPEVQTLEKNLAMTNTALETARAERDELTGRIKAQRELLRQRLSELPEAPGELVDEDLKAWLSSQSDKVHGSRQAMFDQFGVRDMEEAHRRHQVAQSLRMELDGAPPDSAFLTDLRLACTEADRIDGLSRIALQQELKRLSSALETEEQRWRQAQQFWEASRESYEALLKEDPKRLLPENMTQFRNLGREYPQMQLHVPQECDGGWIEFVQANSVGEGLQRRVHDLMNERTARLANLVPVEITRGLEEANQALAEAQAKIEVLAQKRDQQSGAFQGRRLEHNRLLRSDEHTGDLEAIELPEEVRPCLEKVRALHSAAQGRYQELLREMKVTAIEDAQRRVEQARLFEAQLEEVSSDLAILRTECVDPQQLENMNLEQLQAEIRSLPERLDQVTRQLNLDQTAYEQRRRDYEKLLEDNPQKLLEGNLQQFRLLAEERPAFALSVPEAWSTDWQRLVEHGGLLEPARENLATQRSEIARRRDAVPLPPVELELLQHRLVDLDTKIKRIAGEKDSVTADIMQRQGSIQEKADLFHRRALAEENYEKAQTEQRQVELEAESIKLLWSTLEAVKTELESDLVGPLRQRINRRLGEITAGRYSGIKLEQDFRAEMLLTSRMETPLENLSFGTREQVAFLSRLCLAELLSEKERHLVVFDDNLVHTDAERMECACRILQEVAKTAQILLLTCHPERFEGLPAELRRELPMQP
jgi:hypothetical protein